MADEKPTTEQPKPKIDPAIVKLLEDENTLVVVPRAYTERPNALDGIKQRYCGDKDKFRATVVEKVYTARFRKGDKVVFGVVNPNELGDGVRSFVGPVEVSDHWDPIALRGAGGLNVNSFFSAVVKFIHPLTCARRDDNGADTFETRLV